MLKKIIVKVLLFVNAGAVLALIFSYLATHVSPALCAGFAFFGLVFPYIAALNLFFVIFWGFRRKAWALVSLVALLSGWNHLKSTFRFGFATGKQPEAAIKLISYNVRSFDRFKWAKEKNSKQHIFNFLQQEKADIICFQEFFSTRQNENIDTLTKLLKAKNCHAAFLRRPGKIYLSGVATFSVFPIVNQGEIQMPDEHKIGIFSDLKIGNDTLRVFNCHLQSYHLGYKNYNFIDSISSTTAKHELGEIFDILRKLQHGYAKRAQQAEKLVSCIKKSPHKVVVCGDFNDTPVSYAYQQILRHSLVDAFVESGQGFGNTYVRKKLRFRIDFILHSQSLQSSQFSTTRLNFSDHYPVQCLFDWQTNE